MTQIYTFRTNIFIHIPDNTGGGGCVSGQICVMNLLVTEWLSCFQSYFWLYVAIDVISYHYPVTMVANSVHFFVISNQ
jgi:hypothetical protein